MNNPLVDAFAASGPIDFPRVQPQHFLPAIEHVVQSNRDAVEELLQQSSDFDWHSLMQPLEVLDDRLNQIWSIISHLNAVANSPAVRDAHAACLPVLTDYSTWQGQHRGLFDACRTLHGSDAYLAMSVPQQKVLDNMLRDFKLAGVDLPDREQQRYAALKTRLAECATQFSNNVLDATEAYALPVDDIQRLQGVPENVIEAAAQRAATKQQQGYLLTLDMPSYLPVMQYCSDRTIREALYRAYTCRASDLDVAGESKDMPARDNSGIMDEILALRQELAQLLGYANYAERSVATKMAESPQQIEAFLQDLAARCVPGARKEFAELQQFARRELGLDALQAWDVPFAAEAMRLARYDLSQEMLRPYFPVERVIEGLFATAHRLYGIEVVAQPCPGAWHEDVSYYHIYRDGEIVASFYFDLFARDGKRGGAWMADGRSRRAMQSGELQIPLAFLVCNFTPPGERTPSLLTHNEVTTLFHEFGHGLHHMLTAIDCAGVSGINGVPWDAVELPSQFMENWCWQPEALALIAAHYQTDEPLPAAMLEKMQAARNFHSALQMVRQLEFALFDLRIHRDYGSSDWHGVQATLDQVRDEVAAVPTPEFNRFQHSFGHIFAGGYAAGYYSYKWAEVLSADAFSLFEEQGIFDPQVGKRFLETILQRGGSEAPGELFRRFRGRPPTIDALLRHAGITAAVAGH